jgi:hypothetical protein
MPSGARMVIRHGTTCIGTISIDDICTDYSCNYVPPLMKANYKPDQNHQG